MAYKGIPSDSRSHDQYCVVGYCCLFFLSSSCNHTLNFIPRFYHIHFLSSLFFFFFYFLFWRKYTISKLSPFSHAILKKIFTKNRYFLGNIWFLLLRKIPSYCLLSTLIVPVGIIERAIFPRATYFLVFDALILFC